MSHGNGRSGPLSRRHLLRTATLAGLAAPFVAACQQAPATPQVVERVVTQVVEKPVEKVVTQVVTQVQTQVVERQVTQVVERQVTQIVERQVTQAPQIITQVVTPTAVPKPVIPTTRKAGGTLNIWLPNGWPEQSWMHISNWESGWAISPQGDRLFFVKPDGSLEPQLGESATPSADGKKWTLKLRAGLRWSDGQPITASDIEYSILTFFSPKKKPVSELRAGLSIIGMRDYATGKANGVEGMRVVDPQTLEFNLSAPDATMRTLWFGTLWPPIPKHATEKIPIEGLGADKYWITAPLSSGPYKFVKYVPDQYIEYDPNPNFWDQGPRANKLFMRIANPEVAIVSLQKGEIDLINPLQYTEVARLRDAANVEIVEAKNQAQWYGLERNFYTKNGIWRNPKAVQGLLYAIDRKAYVDSILQGFGVVRHSFYDGTPYACPSLTKYDYNPDMAKKLWEEIGMPKDKPISFMSWLGIKARLDYLPIAQEYIRKIGYRSEVDLIDNALITDYINGKGPRGKDWDFHVLLYGMGVDPGTPEVFVDPALASNLGYRSWPEPPGADGKKKPEWVYNNPKMSELFIQGRSEADPAKRTAIYQQIDCIWNQEMPAIMTASPSFVVAKSRRLAGMNWQTNAGLGNWTIMYKPGDWWVAE